MATTSRACACLLTPLCLESYHPRLGRESNLALGARAVRASVALLSIHW
jgi:hypothetical protein